MAKNEIRLDQLLEILLDKLQEKGVLPDMNGDAQKSLLRKTLENVEQAISDEPLNLKNPESLIKLSTALVATHAMENNKKYEFDFKLLLTKELKDPEVEKQINRLEEELNKQNPEMAKNFKRLLVEVVKDILVDNPEMKSIPVPEPRMENQKSPDNKLVGVYDDAGNLLDLLDGVYGGKSLYDTILSVNEVVSSSFEEEHVLEDKGGFFKDIGESIGNRERHNSSMNMHP